MSDHSSNAPFGQNEDPFWEDFVPPHADEIREQARIVRQDNQDALRHCIEVVAWETFDYPHLTRYIIPLFWLCNDVQLHWIAEAFSMSVQDVCTLVEGNPIIDLNCLDCGVELRPRHRDHLLLMSNSLKAVCEDEDVGADSAQFTNLLCQTCINERAADEENQQLLDEARLQALLNEYRKKPYGERRQSQEWSVLKQRIHRRDGYRCRLCGRNDLTLHLHHCTYDNYAQEKLADLITLCAECHGGFHSLFEVS